MSQEELLDELKRLFLTAYKFDEFEFVNVLIGYNGVGDQRALTHLYESRAYITDMKAQLAAAREKYSKTRLGLHIYCHIFEMDELYNVLGNLMRIAVNQNLRYLPDLYNGRNESLYPTDKFLKLKDLGEQSHFTDFIQGLESLYSNRIRNAFLHSAYSLIDDDFCIVKGEGVTIGGSRHHSVSIENYLLPLIESVISFIDTLFELVDGYKMAYRANKIVQARMPEPQPVVILGDAETGLIGFQTFVGSWIKIKSAYGTDHFVEAMNLRFISRNGLNHELGERLEQYIEKLTPFGKDFNSVRDETIASGDPDLIHNLAIVYYNWANNTAITAEGKPPQQQDAIYNSAKERYEKAIQTDPSFGRSYHNMATTILKQAKNRNGIDLKIREDVLALFEKTISLDKNMFEAWQNSARILSEIGNYEIDPEKQLGFFKCSIERYNTAIELYPRDADPYENLGWIHRRMANLDIEPEVNFKASIENYQKAMELEPGLAESLSLATVLGDYAEISETEGRELLERAVALLTEAQQKFGDNSDLNYRLGNKYMVMANLSDEPDKLNSAIACYEKAIQLDASNVQAMNNWSNAELVKSTNESDDQTALRLIQNAKSRLERVVKLDSAHEMGWYNLGLANIELAKKNAGDKNSLLDEAVTQLKQADSVKPNLGSFDLARAYAIKGETGYAIEYLKKWLKTPDSSGKDRIADESDFASLKDNAEFKKLMVSGSETE